MEFEYKVIHQVIATSGGRWFGDTVVVEDSVASIEERLGQMGADGWELVGVLPITNSSSPAQIYGGLHYFKRPVESPARPG